MTYYFNSDDLEKYNNILFNVLKQTEYDNIETLNKWKNYRQILEDYKIYVYPRYGSKFKLEHNNITYLDGVPMMGISAMFIRKSIKTFST